MLIDPHFPEARMQGKAAIREAMRGAFSGMRSFGYSVPGYFESEDGQGAAVETATHHFIRPGWNLDFLQVFVFEAAPARLTPIQAYEPSGPGGVRCIFLFLGRLRRRILGSTSTT